MSHLGEPAVKIKGKVCPHCNKAREIWVPKSGLEAYQNGAYLQDAFPQLTPGEREAFITGFCDEFWEQLFPKEER